MAHTLMHHLQLQCSARKNVSGPKVPICPKKKYRRYSVLGTEKRISTLYRRYVPSIDDTSEVPKQCYVPSVLKRIRTNLNFFESPSKNWKTCNTFYQSISRYWFKIPPVGTPVLNLEYRRYRYRYFFKVPPVTGTRYRYLLHIYCGCVPCNVYLVNACQRFIYLTVYIRMQHILCSGGRNLKPYGRAPSSKGPNGGNFNETIFEAPREVDITRK